MSSRPSQLSVHGTDSGAWQYTPSSPAAKQGIPRAIEGVVALATLACLSPVLCAISLLLILYSGRPVLFRQTRMGRRGRPFTFYKFRSMRPSEDGPLITADDDARVTPIGRFLRRTKLDELPELWNVLSGDMSLVGPRPEVVAYVRLNDARWQAVLEVRPGLTDPVTLALRNEQALLRQVRENREQFYLQTLQPFKLRGYIGYLDRRSPWTDVGVLWKTFMAILVAGCTPPPTIEEIEANGAVWR